MTMCIAEVLGTGILLFVGCMGSIGTMGSIPPPLQSSMAFGMTVNLLIMVNMRQTLKKKKKKMITIFSLYVIVIIYRNRKFLLTQMLGHISGAHLNPAVTIGAVILGIKTIPTGILYAIAQFIGATIGYGLLMVQIFNLLCYALRYYLSLLLDMRHFFTYAYI